MNAAPSVCGAEVAAPHKKSFGNVIIVSPPQSLFFTLLRKRIQNNMWIFRS
jgi:hypothetical protein